jgi:hypothetical protein
MSEGKGLHWRAKSAHLRGHLPTRSVLMRTRFAHKKMRQAAASLVWFLLVFEELFTGHGARVDAAARSQLVHSPFFLSVSAC